MGANLIPQLRELRHQIVIETITSTNTNEFNEQIPVYDPYSMGVTRWAKITILRSETLSINTAPTRANLEHLQITFRYLEGLNVNQRIYFSGSIYRITGINNIDNRNLWHVVDAVEVVG